jgi:crotonobetainyl-CoA:carnitine CoA-transferase CaiB-like acyl-CoA transferase
MRQPLDGAAILEYGERIAVGACGSILLALGAGVSVFSPAASRRLTLPPEQTRGKERIESSTALREAAARADIVITSSDVTPIEHSRAESQIVCDITAYGRSGPWAGAPHSDALVQAMSGLADTTGEPDGPPALCPFPQTEGIAALYAAAGILTAWLVRMRSGRGQSIEIAMFDCAFSTLSTFLPFHFVGKTVSRSGNRHVLASPWNAYRAGDGWLLVCTGSDEQWKRLCEVIGQPQLARDPTLARGADRVQHRTRIDAAIGAWISRLPAADAAQALQAQGIAAGPVVPVGALETEPNIAHRGLYTPQGMRSAIAYFGADLPLPPAPTQEPARSSGHWTLPSPTGRRVGDEGTDATAFDRPPLAGCKVLELGQYTTAPLVARNLGALGADVLKVEPPGGDATREWPPQQHGQGYFFALSNSDKRSACLDLRSPDDRNRFAALVRNADVLVENLKPGSLDKLGFDAAARSRINPALVYCAISGFGADSVYPGRPAFDTVIQAMSGIMDSIRVDGVPQKTGISFADILGGLFALVGTIAALLAREKSGTGDQLDISMQDAAAWIAQWQRHGYDRSRDATIVRCADGHLAAENLDALPELLEQAARLPRAEMLARLSQHGIAAAYVHSITEVAESLQARARGLLHRVRDSAGREWPVFASPIRSSTPPARAPFAIGPLGETGNPGFHSDG